MWAAHIPEDILDRITTGVRQLTSSEAWRDYLAFAARFYHYSFLNTLLIRMAGGTNVAGFHHWRQMGRYVQRGARGIAILAPMRRTVRVDDEETGEPRRCERLVGFRTAYVFDISVTDGEPIPEVPRHRLTGEAPDHVTERLVEYAARLGYTVDLRASFSSPTTNAQTVPAERCIAVRRDLAPAHRVKTLAHELAHALLHADAVIAGEHDRELCELEAESVAFVIMSALRVDAAEYSLGYLASWLQGQDPEAAIQAIGDRVQRTVRQILDALDVVGTAKAAA